MSIGARGNFLNFLVLRHPVGRVSLSGFSWTSGLCEVARALSPNMDMDATYHFMTLRGLL